MEDAKVLIDIARRSRAPPTTHALPPRAASSSSPSSTRVPLCTGCSAPAARCVLAAFSQRAWGFPPATATLSCLSCAELAAGGFDQLFHCLLHDLSHSHLTAFRLRYPTSAVKLCSAPARQTSSPAIASPVAARRTPARRPTSSCPSSSFIYILSSRLTANRGSSQAAAVVRRRRPSSSESSGSAGSSSSSDEANEAEPPDATARRRAAVSGAGSGGGDEAARLRAVLLAAAEQLGRLVGAAEDAGECIAAHPGISTVIQHDGPDHLGLWFIQAARSARREWPNSGSYGRGSCVTPRARRLRRARRAAAAEAAARA